MDMLKISDVFCKDVKGGTYYDGERGLINKFLKLDIVWLFYWGFLVLGVLVFV